MSQMQVNDRSQQAPIDQQRQTAILEALSSLSYRSGDLKGYLHAITLELSRLLALDWSTVTLCQDGYERVLASSINFDGMDDVFSLHGSLTDTVVKTGRSLIVPDARLTQEFGEPPDGYLSYLGVPLQTSDGKVIGTICSFNMQPCEFLTADIRTAELFAQRAATAIEHYRLYQKQRQFNAILEQEVAKRTEELHQAQTQFLQKERLAAIGEFAAVLMREVRQPFQVVQSGLTSAATWELPAPSKERLDLALDEAHRLEHLLAEISLYAKPQELALTGLDLNQLVQAMVEPMQAMAEMAGRHLKVLLSPTPVWVKGDRDKLKQVFINLVRNAGEAAPEGSTVQWQITLDQPHRVGVQVHNGGDPIPPQILSKLTEPFCSTKTGGTGLGLAIVRRIVEAHRGQFQIESAAEVGTTAQVWLPMIKDGA
jgi:signal transduction histidine kinase